MGHDVYLPHNNKETNTWGCGDVIISTIYINVLLRRHVVGIKRIVVTRGFILLLIDGVCFLGYCSSKRTIEQARQNSVISHRYIAQKCLPTQ